MAATARDISTSTCTASLSCAPQQGLHGVHGPHVRTAIRTLQRGPVLQQCWTGQSCMAGCRSMLMTLARLLCCACSAAGLYLGQGFHAAGPHSTVLQELAQQGLHTQRSA